MTRLEVLSRLPSEVRTLVRNFEANIEDNAVTRTERPSFPFMEKLNELDAMSWKSIRGLLSLYFKGEELEESCHALSIR